MAYCINALVIRYNPSIQLSDEGNDYEESEVESIQEFNRQATKRRERTRDALLHYIQELH